MVLALAAAATAMATAAAVRSAGGVDPASPTAADAAAAAEADGHHAPVASRSNAARAVVARRRARGVAELVVENTELPSPDADPYDAAVTSGYVRTPEGDPVSGAFVALGDVDSSDTTAVTRSDGRFALDDGGSYTSVTAVALRDGRIWTGSQDADGWGLELEIELRPATGRDRVTLVRVLDHDGAPVPEAHAVPVGGTPLRPWHRSSSTSVRDGWFAVAASRWRRGDDPVYLVEGARGCGPALVQVDPRGPPVVEVRLPRGVALVGRVVTPDGRPVVDEPVLLDFAPMPAWFEFDDATPFARPSPLRARTDADGRFEFVGLARAAGLVHVEPGGDRLGGGLALVDAAHDREIVIQLRPTTDVVVTVTDDAGTPIEHATVWALLGKNGVVDVLDRVDDADRGESRLTGIPVGVPMTLKVWAVGFVPVHLRDWLAAPTTVSLRREGRVEGCVLGPDGAPLVDVPLTVRAEGEPRVVWLSTDPGRFAVLGVPVGTPFRLELTDSGRVLAEHAGTAPAPDALLRWPHEANRLTLALDRFDEGKWLSGVVVRHGDRVLASAVPTGPILVLESSTWPDHVDVQVGPDAARRIALLGSVPSRGFTRVTMRDGERLRGALTAPDGQEVGVAHCTVTNAAGFELAFDTEEDGTFEVVGVPGAHLTLAASACDGLRARVEVASLIDALDVPLVRD